MDIEREMPTDKLSINIKISQQMLLKVDCSVTT
jgi:hypothetical protein